MEPSTITSDTWTSWNSKVRRTSRSLFFYHHGTLQTHSYNEYYNFYPANTNNVQEAMEIRENKTNPNNTTWKYDQTKGWDEPIVENNSPNSKEWLQVISSPHLGTLLDSDTFKIAVAIRLGASMYLEHTCYCGKNVNNFGLHGLRCQNSYGRRPRHSVLKETIRRALSSAFWSY